LFHLNRISFWREIKRMERQTNCVNIDVEKLKTEYEKIFNETYCKDGVEETKRVVVEKFLRKHEKTKFKLQGLVNELKCGKANGLRGVSNEKLKYRPSAKLIGILTSFNISVLKPILKNENKSNSDISNKRPVAISDAIQNLYERLLL